MGYRVLEIRSTKNNHIKFSGLFFNRRLSSKAHESINRKIS